MKIGINKKNTKISFFKNISIIIISTFFWGCSNKVKPSNTQNKKLNIKKANIDIKEQNKKKILRFLILQQELLKNNQIEELSKNVLFPLDGDALYFMIYGENFLKDPEKIFKNKVSKDIFLKKSYLIFPKIYVDLLNDIDFSKKTLKIDTEYSSKKTDNNEVFWSVDISVNPKDNSSFTIYFNKKTKEDDEETYSVFYKYKLINEKYLLSYIGSLD